MPSVGGEFSKGKRQKLHEALLDFSSKLTQMRFCHSWRGIREGEEKPEESHLNLEGKIRNEEELFSAASMNRILSTTWHNHPAMCPALKSRMMIKGGEICGFYTLAMV